MMSCSDVTYCWLEKKSLSVVFQMILLFFLSLSRSVKCVHTCKLVQCVVLRSAKLPWKEVQYVPWTSTHTQKHCFRPPATHTHTHTHTHTQTHTHRHTHITSAVSLASEPCTPIIALLQWVIQSTSVKWVYLMQFSYRKSTENPFL